ncbi:MAG: hypothetical protein ACLRQF_18085 [Thomasclavelia ramosa]
MTCDHTTLDKRSGEAYNYAISALHLHKDECIVIEDALHAIIAAKSKVLQYGPLQIKVIKMIEMKFANK